MFSKILKWLIKNPIVLVIIGVMALLVIVNAKINALNNDIEYWRNQAALTDTITVIDSTINIKLAQTVREIESENKKLNKLLKEEKDKIKAQVEINALLLDSINNLNTSAGSIVIVNNDSVRTRLFKYNANAFKLSGYFEIDNPYRISFDTLSATTDLEINFTENKYGTWKVYVDSKNKNLKLNSIEPKIVPYNKTFWEKIEIIVGAYVGKNNVGIVSDIMYSKYGAIIGYSNNGLLIGGSYRIK